MNTTTKSKKSSQKKQLLWAVGLFCVGLLMFVVLGGTVKWLINFL